MTRVVTRSHRSWYGHKRWKWYWLRDDETTISFSARSYSDEQLAWEDAQHYFGASVTMVYDKGSDPDSHFELYAGPRDWN